MTKDKLIIEKQAELIICLTEALDFLADNNLIKERKDNNDTDNQPLINCVNKSAQLRKDISTLQAEEEEKNEDCEHEHVGHKNVRCLVCDDCGEFIEIDI
jgi:hypothetical protein